MCEGPGGFFASGRDPEGFWTSPRFFFFSAPYWWSSSCQLPSPPSAQSSFFRNLFVLGYIFFSSESMCVCMLGGGVQGKFTLTKSADRYTIEDHLVH